MKFKAKAMRAGAWFKVLPRIDRVLVDLTIRVAENIRSASLAKSILSITEKLEGVLESKFARAIREVGLPLSQKLSQVAICWGYVTAAAWANDKSYARYWAIMKLNGHPCVV
ncbi:MAG: hypothetical protein NWF04_00340 [Candidatus Bathyarchaeota archaeon]|nr:hypothetical protein [Candidatus Bathyarchaeota archaeon]